MIITVRLMGLNMSPDASSITLELSDGATVEHALKKLVSVAEMPWTVDDLMMHVMLVQNRRANKKDVLEDNDTLIVLKTLEGG
jgi:precorrin-2 methylase